jgi:hypothetical protein
VFANSHSDKIIPGKPAPDSRVRADRGLLPAAFLILTAAFALFTLVQLLAPADFHSAGGYNPAGAWHWKRVWRIHTGTLPLDLYVAVLRFSLVACWAAYGLLFWAALKNPCVSRKKTMLAVTAVIALMTLFFPPALTQDPYLYAGFGRMQVLYGVNPYLTGTHILVARHDAVPGVLLHTDGGRSGEIFWTTPTVYGPVWTLTAAATATLARGIGLVGQLLLLKLIGAAALLIAALAGSRLARALGAEHETPVFLAIALNPLLIIEGPGSAHNDVPLAACLILFLLALARGHGGRAGLFVGLAAGIKLFPLALVPWGLAIIRRDGWDRKWLRAAGFTVAAVLPVLAGYALYWRGPATLASLHNSYGATQHAPVLTALLYLGALALLAARRGPSGNPAGGSYAAPGRAILDIRLAIRLWSAFAAWLALYSMPIPYPWYLSWSLGPALCDGAEGSRKPLLILVTLVVAAMLHSYTTPP